MAAAILGYIDCPSCGSVKGMRITHDKNGDPFGYCEVECSQQLRIGGSAKRVAMFIKNHPFAAPKPQVTDTATGEKNPVSVSVPKTATKNDADGKTQPPPKTWLDHLGVSNNAGKPT